jgi:AraC-like DNA-binding protein
MLSRDPRPPLRPFVKTIWLADGTVERQRQCAAREHVLPTGEMHLVFRLTGQPVRLYRDSLDADGVALGSAVIGGPRASYYVKHVSAPSASVGVQLRPGAAGLLFGAPAGELKGRHYRLDDLWGRAAVAARDRLLEEPDPRRRLDVLESLLLERLPRVCGLHPAVAMALERFQEEPGIREVVEESGYSHRRFNALFQDAVGLTPKLYCRVRRFQRALRRVTTGCWADIALGAGYSDQAHFNREFREFSGVTPGEYRRVAPAFANHVAVR